MKIWNWPKRCSLTLLLCVCWQTSWQADVFMSTWWGLSTKTQINTNMLYKQKHNNNNNKMFTSELPHSHQDLSSLFHRVSEICLNDKGSKGFELCTIQNIINEWINSSRSFRSMKRLNKIVFIGVWVMHVTVYS